MGNGWRRSWAWVIAMGLSLLGGAGTFALASSRVASQVMPVVMGISRGGGEPANVAIVGEWWQKENRGFAVGTHHIGFPLGQFVGPAIIAVFATQEDWSKAFPVIPLIGLPLMIAQAVLGTRRNQVRVNDWIVAHGMTPPLDVNDDGRMRRNAVAILRDAAKVPNIVRAVFVNLGFLGPGLRLRQAGSAMGLVIGPTPGLGGAITSAVTGIVPPPGAVRPHHRADVRHHVRRHRHRTAALRVGPDLRESDRRRGHGGHRRSDPGGRRGRRRGHLHRQRNRMEPRRAPRSGGRREARGGSCAAPCSTGLVARGTLGPLPAPRVPMASAPAARARRGRSPAGPSARCLRPASRWPPPQEAPCLRGRPHRVRRAAP
ncbi:MAG: MFS transporter [Propionibacterium acidifaciens]|uniref:MFS transporter n=1 Tax=Propionibacterium acidifaciens TaxID=556499 RepID=UPI00360C488E